MTDENAELRARLEAAQAKSARFSAEATAEAERTALLDQVEAAERDARDKEAVLKAQRDHGPIGKRIAVIESKSGTVILKRANHVLFRKFQDSESTDVALLERLIRPCIVYPDVSSFDRLIEDEPALITVCANAVCGLAGMRAKEVSGK